MLAPYVSVVKNLRNRRLISRFRWVHVSVDAVYLPWTYGIYGAMKVHCHISYLPIGLDTLFCMSLLCSNTSWHWKTASSLHLP